MLNLETKIKQDNKITNKITKRYFWKKIKTLLDRKNDKI